jgi:cell division protease FtsH
MALGVTMQLPIDDKHSYNREYLLAQLAILMAGRIAEEKFMFHMTTGAGNDIERATDLARKMVCEWGMSELGPLSFGKKEEQIFLGREIAQHRDYSEETAIRIDEQVKKLVQGAYDTSLAIIEERREALIKIAESLLVREILDGNEVMQIIKGETLAPLAATPSKDAEDHTQQVLRPEGGRRVPGLSEGERPQPA